MQDNVNLNTRTDIGVSISTIPFSEVLVTLPIYSQVGFISCDYQSTGLIKSLVWLYTCKCPIASYCWYMCIAILQRILVIICIYISRVSNFIYFRLVL